MRGYDNQPSKTKGETTKNQIKNHSVPPITNPSNQKIQQI